MNKYKVIIWGTGSGFTRRKETLVEQYEILALTDNRGNIGTIDGFPLISPLDIKKYPFDKIVICSVEFYESIKYQLIYDYQLKNDQILGISNPEDHVSQKIVFDSIAQYNSINLRSDFVVDTKSLYLISSDYNKTAGSPAPYYFAQDIWGAKKILLAGIRDHYDIGSRLDGFLSHLLIFCDSVRYIDIRPLPFAIPKLEFIQGDATELENIEDNSISSLSSFHAVEHFGLGRYGDQLDPDACFRAMSTMARVLAPEGHLYFGVPIGPVDKLCFNAHRIFYPLTIIKAFASLELVDFSVVIGNNCFENSVALDRIKEESALIPEYSCGLFEFKKR